MSFRDFSLWNFSLLGGNDDSAEGSLAENDSSTMDQPSAFWIAAGGLWVFLDGEPGRVNRCSRAKGDMGQVTWSGRGPWLSFWECGVLKGYHGPIPCLRAYTFF